MHTTTRTITLAVGLALLSSMTPVAAAAQAVPQISYASQPDRLAVFLNDIGFAHEFGLIARRGGCARHPA